MPDFVDVVGIRYSQFDLACSFAHNKRRKPRNWITGTVPLIHFLRKFRHKTKQFGNKKEISEIFHKKILLIVWNEEFGDYFLLLVKIHHLAKLIEWHSAILE